MAIKVLSAPRRVGSIYQANNLLHRISNFESFCTDLEHLCFELFENPIARKYFEQYNISLTFDGVTWKAQCTICPEWPCICIDIDIRVPIFMIALYTDRLLKPIFERHNLAVELE